MYRLSFRKTKLFRIHIAQTINALILRCWANCAIETNSISTDIAFVFFLLLNRLFVRANRGNFFRVIIRLCWSWITESSWHNECTWYLPINRLIFIFFVARMNFCLLFKFAFQHIVHLLAVYLLCNFEYTKFSNRCLMPCYASKLFQAIGLQWLFAAMDKPSWNIYHDESNWMKQSTQPAFPTWLEFCWIYTRLIKHNCKHIENFVIDAKLSMDCIYMFMVIG